VGLACARGGEACYESPGCDATRQFVENASRVIRLVEHQLSLSLPNDDVAVDSDVLRGTDRSPVGGFGVEPAAPSMDVLAAAAAAAEGGAGTAGVASGAAGVAYWRWRKSRGS